MPSEFASSGSPRTKPTTRSSIRHSLNLASVGKAFADVMNKEGRDADKNAKKAKDTSSRRLSAINMKPAVPRTSLGDSRPSMQLSKRANTPESKTITRRRGSAAGLQRSPSDEQPHKPTESASVARSASLRPRMAISSALPKYRPKSVLAESIKQPPSPVRAGIRRRFNGSDEEKEDRGRTITPCTPSAEKVSRPISPLPHRAALRVNLTSANNAIPTTTPPHVKTATPTMNRFSPVRPTKTVKTASCTSAPHSIIPRPPSSTSSSSSFTPRTPKTPNGRTLATVSRSGQTYGSGSPSRLSPHRPGNESPLARHSRKNSKNVSPTVTLNALGNMSHISEGNSEDSEEEDVELLLAPTAPLGAPTPAMPRIQSGRPRKRLPPQTPTRANHLLPTRANLSYLSPIPPDKDGSSSLRPSPRKLGIDRVARGSILSWEQLASEASKTLGDDEIEHMLSEIPAPFRSEAGSPTPSTLMEVPESPCLSAISSPGGYGSISQVLLPDVTPSPAVNHNVQYYDMPTDAPAGDGASVTMLRLQLAAAENTAKERLNRLQSLEEELHYLKEARVDDVKDLTRQVGYMEEQMRTSLEARERADDDRAAYSSSLEDQLRHTQASRDQAVEEAVSRVQEDSKVSQQAALKSQRHVLEKACIARTAASNWMSVRALSTMELNFVAGDRDVLTMLLTELDQMYQCIS